MDQLRTSQIGGFLSSNNGKMPTMSSANRDDDSMSETTDDDDDDDGFDLSKMLSFDPDAPVHPNDTNLKKVMPAQLYLIRKRQNEEAPSKVFSPTQTYHWFRMCNLKVKGFVTYGYEQRFIAAQGYMIYIYKSVAEFLGGKEPTDTFHIAGVNVYNTLQRDESNNSTKYQLVIKSNDLQLHGPSPMAIANAFAFKDKQNSNNNNNNSALAPTSPSISTTSSVMSPKSPTAAGSSGGSSKDEVVLLTPQPFAPNEDLVCGAFRRDHLSKPVKGFNVITFDDLFSHQAMYNFLLALKYQWLMEVSVHCATICERKGYWTSEGIFRLSASSTQLDIIKQQLYSGLYTDIHGYLDEHTFSSLMKVLVREFADGPLMTGLYSKWLEVIYEHEKYEKEIGKDVIARDPEAASKVNAAFTHGVRSVARKLPFYIANYLSILFPLLHHVARFSEQSKMHYQQLAIVFAPNLITAPIGRETLAQQMDNQRKINDMIKKVLEDSYQTFLPYGTNNKPLQNIIMYSLTEPKYLNSVLDDFPLKSVSTGTNTPQQRSPVNAANAKSSFFTPQVARTEPLSIGGNSTKDDTSSGQDVDARIKMGYVNTKHFNPSGGLGSIEGDDESIAGSFYDSNRVVPMPDDEVTTSPIETIQESTGASPPVAPGLDLPPLPPNDLQLASSVADLSSPEPGNELNLTMALCDEQEDHKRKENNLQLALDDEDEKQRYEQERQSMIEQQQKELEEEQLAEYQRVLKEKQAEKERLEKMAQGVKAMLPFIETLQADLQAGTINLTTTTEAQLYNVLQSMQELSEMVKYDRGY